MDLRKSIASLLSVAMLLSMTVIPAAAKEETVTTDGTAVEAYGDVNGHWAEGAIDRWSGYGVVKGAEGLFRPNANMSVAELATVLDNLMGYTEKAENTFADLRGDEWYADAVLKLAAAGIIKGDGKNVNATAPIDRERATVIMARALNIQPDPTANLSGFVDGATASDWSAGYIKAMADAGIVQGVGGGMLDLSSSIDRASIMTIMDKSISNYITEGGTYEAKDTGIIIVKAGAAVTLTGTAKDIIVAPASAKGSVTLDKTTVTGAITVNADNAQLVAKDAKLTDVMVIAAGAAVELQGKSTTKTVVVAESADGAVLSVAKEAKVDVATVSATGTTTEIAGTVNSIGVADTAADTQIKVEKGATVANVETAGDKTAISGEGSVKNVAVTGGEDVKVSTPNTVTTKTETTVDKNGNTVVTKTETTNNSKGEAGTIKTETTTTKPDGTTSTENKTDKPSTGNGGGGSSGPSYTTVTTEAELKAQLAAGGYVRLGGDISIADTLTVPSGKNVNLDLNGKKITTTQVQNTGSNDPDVYMIINMGTMVIDGNTAGSEIKAGFNKGPGTRQVRAILNKEGTITLNGGTYTGYYVVTNNIQDKAAKAGVVSVNNATLVGCFAGIANFQNATANITNSNISSVYYALVNNGTYGKTVFNVSDSTLESSDDTAIYFPAGDELTLTNCTVNAPKSSAIEAFAGKVSLKGSTTVTAGGAYKTVTSAGDGSRMDGSAILMGYREGYKTTGKLEVNVDESVKLNSKNGHCIRIVLLGTFDAGKGINEIDLGYYSESLKSHGNEKAPVINEIGTIPSGLNVSTTVFDETALATALAAGGTVKLGANIAIDPDALSTAWREKTVVLDLNKKTLTLNNNSTTVFVGPSRAGENAAGEGENCGTTDVTISNGTIEANNTTGTIANFVVDTGHKLTLDGIDGRLTMNANGSAFLVRGKDATLTIKNSNITTTGVYVVTTNANKAVNYGVKISIEDSNLKTESKNGDSCAILINVPSTVDIKGGSIVGQRQALFVRSGDVTVDGTTISAVIGEYENDNRVGGKWDGGDEADFGAVVVGKVNDTYKGDINLTLNNCTISCTLLGGYTLDAKYCNAIFAIKKDTTMDVKVNLTGSTSVTNGNVVEWGYVGTSSIITGYNSTILSTWPVASNIKFVPEAETNESNEQAVTTAEPDETIPGDIVSDETVTDSVVEA